MKNCKVLDLCESGEAEQALTEVLSIYDEAPVGLTVVGIDLRFKRINQKLAEINGVPVECHIGRTVREVVPRIAEAVEGIIREVIETGKAIRDVDVEGDTPLSLGMTRRFSAHFSPLKDAGTGEVVAVNVVVEEVTDKKRVEQLLSESEQRTAAALRVGNIGVFERSFRPTSKLYWDQTIRRIWGVSDTEPISEELLWKTIHPEDVGAVHAFRERIYKATGPIRFDTEYRIRRLSDGALRWVAICIDVLFDEEGPLRLIGTAQDITDRRLTEERTKLLMREVNHRSKNLLSVVQAIATQTLKSSDAETFGPLFSERLASLASTQDLVVQNHWTGVALGDLITSQLSHFRSLIGHRIHPRGPSLIITSAAAQDLGMALHELSTNAAKYGALSDANGEVEITWGLSSDSAGQSFNMKWTETKGPRVSPPARKGFGTLVTSRLLQSAMKAEVSLEYLPTGVAWSLHAPADAVMST